MYEYEDDEAGGRSIGRLIVVAIIVVGVVAGGWFVVNGRGGGEGGAGAALPTESTVASTPGPTLASASTAPGTTASAISSSTDGVATTSAESTTTTPGTTTTTAPPQTTTTERPTSTTERPRSTSERPPRQRRQRQRPVSYETLPDGSPVPVHAIFDVNQITLTGAVPDRAAKGRLQALALANAKPGQGNIVNFLTINREVPRNVGVRVVELTSARFPPGSADVMPEHALELDRVVSIMSALPNITALVIGHSDQRGDEQANFELSAARAASVLDYLATHGVDPSRLSSRAVGEADLLTLNNDAAALALNRRTEFVFYGLLNP
jgi:outer membrane protein OmpA-like peptidoglycan-associated protein